MYGPPSYVIIIGELWTSKNSPFLVRLVCTAYWLQYEALCNGGEIVPHFPLVFRTFTNDPENGSKFSEVTNFNPFTWLPYWQAVASLRWVTSRRCHPCICFWENLATFFVLKCLYIVRFTWLFSRQFCGVTPGFFFSKTDDLFCSSLSLSLSLFIAFTRVSPPSRVSPHTFFTCPTSFLHYSL